MGSLIQIKRDKAVTPNPAIGTALDEGELMAVVGVDATPPANGTRGDLWVGTADGNLQLIDSDAPAGGDLVSDPAAGDNTVKMIATATYAMSLAALADADLILAVKDEADANVLEISSDTQSATVEFMAGGFLGSNNATPDVTTDSLIIDGGLYV